MVVHAEAFFGSWYRPKFIKLGGEWSVQEMTSYLFCLFAFFHCIFCFKTKYVLKEQSKCKESKETRCWGYITSSGHMTSQMNT